jgi:DNA-binding transcriptional ArsR family regulator
MRPHEKGCGQIARRDAAQKRITHIQRGIQEEAAAQVQPPGPESGSEPESRISNLESRISGDTPLTAPHATATLNHMVQQNSLDQAFAALADPTRREVLTRLGEGKATVSELAEPAGITITGMAKHLRVLEDAGLVVTEKVGRTRYCRLGTEKLDDAMAWITFYQRLWDRRLDGLDAYFTLQKGLRK